LECTFRKCQFSSTTFERCTFEDCRFEDCELSLFVPDDSSLQGVNFLRCKVDGVDWSRANALGFDVRFVESRLDYSSFSGMRLQGLHILESTAIETVFSHVDLSRASFDGTDLAGAVFEGATLTDTDFRQAKNLFISSTTNTVKRTKISLETALAQISQLGFEVSV
ncbi:MAG: pentapeptide repeat-containing protein, partial [Myxococcales bacterium]|nr:pentapeptide repeat-containing protein [Myxococcales bacterium]